MALQNRVTPRGELVADPARGLVYGNRGCLHDAHGRIRRRYAGKRWIACRLEFRGRRRTQLLQPGRYTELFFLDEVTAFAAGHRPCAECRRADYDRFVAIWGTTHPGQAGADAMDAQLHAERVDPATRGQRLHGAKLGELPDGAFVPPRRRAVPRPRAGAAALDSRRLRPSRVAAGPRARRPAHAAVARRSPACRLGAARPAPAPVG